MNKSNESTEEERRFAFLVEIEDMTQKEAYLTIRPNSNPNGKNPYVNACDFNKRKGVQLERARLREAIQSEYQKAAHYTAEQYGHDLKKMIDEAWASKSYTAALQGMKILGTKCGFLEHRTRHIHEVDKSAQEIFAELVDALGPEKAKEVFEKESGMPAPEITHQGTEAVN